VAFWDVGDGAPGGLEDVCDGLVEVGGAVAVLCSYDVGGVFLLFILGSNLVGGGPVRGLRGGGRRGWCEEWARSC
jgi:hypothetical protein